MRFINTDLWEQGIFWIFSCKTTFCVWNCTMYIQNYTFFVWLPQSYMSRLNSNQIIFPHFLKRNLSIPYLTCHIFGKRYVIFCIERNSKLWKDYSCFWNVQFFISVQNHQIQKKTICWQFNLSIIFFSIRRELQTRNSFDRHGLTD